MFHFLDPFAAKGGLGTWCWPMRYKWETLGRAFLPNETEKPREEKLLPLFFSFPFLLRGTRTQRLKTALEALREATLTENREGGGRALVV